MAGYSDLDSAQVQLSLDPDVETDADDIALLAAIDAEMSATFDLKTGTTFGASGAATAKTIDGAAVGRSDILLLPVPVRSVSSVVISGSFSETLNQSVTPGDGGQYVLWNPNQFGDYRALKRIDFAGWPQRNGYDRITVTAVWADSTGGDVPQPVIDALTFIAVETFRQRKTSPTGEIGPEGFTIRPRNPWNYEQVKEAIKRYSVSRVAL